MGDLLPGSTKPGLTVSRYLQRAFAVYFGPRAVNSRGSLQCAVKCNRQRTVSVLDNGNGERNFRQRRQAFCDFFDLNRSQIDLKPRSNGSQLRAVDLKFFIFDLN